jgi:formate dehydrogenase gamma subunit
MHAVAAAEGKNAPGCVTCHRSHGPGLPPAAGAVSKMCAACHDDAISAVERGGHFHIGEDATEQLNCSSCHEAHATSRPHLSNRVVQKCNVCHEDDYAEFAGSVHADLMADGEMNCVSCHATHVAEGQPTDLDAGCAVCHEDEELDYRSSAHRLGRIRGEHAASCADCHEGHTMLAAADTASSIHPRNIAATCAACHADAPVLTSDFVRLPLSVPSYLQSVHGLGYENGSFSNGRWNSGRTATCTDCHGVHDLRSAEDRESSINHYNIAATCGRCHEDIVEEYSVSIHGKAVSLGLRESPTCTDCHDEHLIKRHDDPTSRVSAEHRAKELCGDCHTNVEMLSKYGMEAGVVESYLDSYHGWAVDRGSQLVATCTDCHNVHEIRSPLDPASSVHVANVTETCRRCHPGSNPTFAQSYTHAAALRAKGYDDYARYIYIGLIIFVLGGMTTHNMIISRYEFRRIYKRRRAEPYVQRWHRAERLQHLALLLSFSGLAITGFALRFPDAWWVHVIGLAGNEALRANVHRYLAVLMTLVTVYHAVWILVTRRGRWALGEMAPRRWDVTQMFENLAFHMKLRKERPAFRMFDYTQKAEYWAVVWGSLVMMLTGFVLWFPTVATAWMPAWTVRVSEVVHFYEAILAVAAIFIWHFFYVIFMPNEYPMSMVWFNGRYPAAEWKEFHRQEYDEVGDAAIRYPEGGAEHVTSGDPAVSNEQEGGEAEDGGSNNG